MTSCRLFALVLLIPFLFLSLAAHAHKASDSFLYLNDHTIRVDIAIEDVLRFQSLDEDGDGAVSWGELKVAESQIATHLIQRIALHAGQQRCNLSASLAGLSQHSDGAYSVWNIQSPCLAQGASGRAPLWLDYQLLFAQDPMHRGLYRLQRGDDVQYGVLSPQSSQVSWQQQGYWITAKTFFVQGVVHLVTGYDHLLFLLALLIPVLRRQQGQRGLGEVIKETAWIVTMFTVAHSITLALATLGLVVLPSGPVEIAIALSVTAAALLALTSVGYRYQMMLALGFGLIHGFGFAGMLSGLLEASAGKAVALLSFNVGIELAQLAVVAVLVPLLFSLRHHRFFAIASPLTSSVIAVVGLYWAWLRV